MVFGLWLGYSILGMKIVTVDKYTFGNTHTYNKSLKNYWCFEIIHKSKSSGI